MNEKLLEIQKEIGAIAKDSTNPFYKSRYFDINSLLAQVKPILNKHGIVVLQGLNTTEGKIGLNTALVDSSTGKKIEFTCPLPENPDPQKMGSIITYFRRYALQSLLALESEDDDGNSGSDGIAPSGLVKRKPKVDDVPF